MKAIFKFVVCGVALSLFAPICAAPSPQIEGLQPVDFSVPSNGTSNDTISSLGYDPSDEWQGWATVEVWTGGSKRQPVNVGNVVGYELFNTVTDTLKRTCYSPYGKYCGGSTWQSFRTHYVSVPPAGIKETSTRFRTTSAQWANDRIREIMINIVGSVLYAYTTQPLGTNCYEVPGQGRYCNVPQFIRVHLPNSSPDDRGLSNEWFLEMEGLPSKFSYYGNLKPCGTRAAVDHELDRYQTALIREFPEWKGRFKRETKVIIDGYKSCTTEP